MDRFPASAGGSPGAAELLRVVRFEQPDQQRVGVLPFEGHELAAVIDRLGDPIDGDLARLLLEPEGMLPLNGSKRLPVGLRDPHGVVVQLAGNPRLGSGNPNDAINLVGIEKRLLGLGQGFGHRWVPI